MADASQDEHEGTFNFIEDIHSCPAACSLQRYKNQTNKVMKQLGNKLGFVQTFHVANYRV